MDESRRAVNLAARSGRRAPADETAPMMTDGLYHVAFQTAFGSGQGVATVQDGRLRGGDADYSFKGVCTGDSRRIVAEIQVERRKQGRGGLSGQWRAIDIRLEGQPGVKASAMTGTLSASPDQPVAAVLTRISD